MTGLLKLEENTDHMGKWVCSLATFSTLKPRAIDQALSRFAKTDLMVAWPL